MKNYLVIVCIAVLFASCTKEYDCKDAQLSPTFIGFDQADIETLFIRKFKANDGFQTIIDSFTITKYQESYNVRNDTTIIFAYDEAHYIKAGFDWAIFIPAVNRSIAISNISGEKKTGKCGSGILAMDRFGCNCTNRINSITVNSQVIPSADPDNASQFIFIHR